MKRFNFVYLAQSYQGTLKVFYLFLATFRVNYLVAPESQLADWLATFRDLSR